MIVSDDVSDDDNIDDGTECDDDYVEMRECDLENAEGATFDKRWEKFRQTQQW